MMSHRGQSPFRRALLLLPAFVVAFAALAIASLPEAALGAPGDKGNASIDWSMPDRYGADGIGLVAADQTQVELQVRIA